MNNPSQPEQHTQPTYSAHALSLKAILSAVSLAT